MIGLLEFEMSSEQLLNQLFDAIETVKKFRKLMKDALIWIRRHYDYEMYLWEVRNGDYFTRITNALKCDLILDLRTKKLTIKSWLDPKIKETIQLYKGKEYWDFVGREQEKEEKARGTIYGAEAEVI